MREKRKNNLFKKAGLGAILILTLMAPITSCAAKVEANPFQNYPTTAEVMKDTKTNYTINLRGKDGKVTQLDKKFNYGIKMVNERTSVAMADITDSLPELNLGWDGTNRIASATGEGKELKYPINKRVMSNNGIIEEMDTSATIDSKVSRTYLPLRSLMESLGYDVEYEHSTRTIDIYEEGVNKIVVKPVEKPVEKPNEYTGPVASFEYRKESTWKNNKPFEVDIKRLETPTYANLPIIPKVGEQFFPNERRVDYVGKRMADLDDLDFLNFTMYDGTEFYKEYVVPFVTTREIDKDYKQRRATIDGIEILPAGMGQAISIIAAEDTEGNIYSAAAHSYSILSGNKEKPLFGATIKTLYFYDGKYSSLMKVELSKPLNIPSEAGEFIPIKY